MTRANGKKEQLGNSVLSILAGVKFATQSKVFYRRSGKTSHAPF